MSGLLVALVLLPLAGALCAAVAGTRRAEICARAGAVATAGSFALAVALTVAVALGRHPSVGGALLALFVLVVVAAGYVALVGAVTGFLAPALAGTQAAGASPWLLLVVLGVMAAVTAVRYASGPGFLRDLHSNVYVLALSRGAPVAGRHPNGSGGGTTGVLHRRAV